MSQELIACPLYNPDAGDRLRIVIHYAGVWRAIFWFQLARDGSVYLGPRYVEITLLRYGAAEKMEGRQFHVSYSDGTEIADPEVCKRAKLSFHASGIINTPAGRLTRGSLRTISEQQLLCSAVFQHLSTFEPIQEGAVKKRDVCFRYPVDEGRPLWAHLYVASKEKAQRVRTPSAVFQINSLFEYSGLDGVPDLLLQLVLGHGAAGPWPPQTYLLFPTMTGST